MVDLLKLIENADAARDAEHKRQIAQDEDQRSKAIAAYRQARSWFDDVFLKVLKEQNERIRSKNACFEVSRAHDVPPLVRREIYFKRNGQTSQPYVLWVDNPNWGITPYIRASQDKNTFVFQLPINNSSSLTSPDRQALVIGADDEAIAETLGEILADNV